MPAYAKRVDENQPAVVEELRTKYGLSVQPIHTIGKGVPDLIVGVAGCNFLIELKSHDKAKLTKDEGTWHSSWKGQVSISTQVGHVIYDIIMQLKRMPDDPWARSEKERLLRIFVPTPDVKPIEKEVPVDTVAHVPAPIVTPTPDVSSRLVIIDGPKGVGKSTVAKLLVQHLEAAGVPATYHKHYRDPEHEFEAMTEMLSASSMDIGPVIVVDRLIWTEWVMGIAYERDDASKLTQRCRLLDHLAHLQGVPHVLLSASVDTLKTRLAERPEEERRKVDMPWELVTPLWSAAYGQSHMRKMRNETPEDQDRILNYLLIILGVDGGLSATKDRLAREVEPAL
jgi:cytidylate kinase